MHALENAQSLLSLGRPVQLKEEGDATQSKEPNVIREEHQVLLCQMLSSWLTGQLLAKCKRPGKQTVIRLACSKLPRAA